ncbi:glycosyltransferase, partial [Aeromonas caviae]
MNSDRALRHEPKRHGIGQGWIWIRTGFDIFNKGMGASVAMIVLWFVVGIVLDQLPVAIPLLKLLCGRRVVYYCHFPDKEISAALARQRGDHGLRAMVRRLYRLPLDVLEEATTKAADRILVNSHFTAAHFRRVFPHIVCRPRVVYPAVD